MPAYKAKICGIYTALNVVSVQTRAYKLKRVQHLAVEIQANSPSSSTNLLSINHLIFLNLKNTKFSLRN